MQQRDKSKDLHSHKNIVKASSFFKQGSRRTSNSSSTKPKPTPMLANNSSSSSVVASRNSVIQHLYRRSHGPKKYDSKILITISSKVYITFFQQKALALILVSSQPSSPMLSSWPTLYSPFLPFQSPLFQPPHIPFS